MHKKGKILKIAKQNYTYWVNGIMSLGLELDLSVDEVQWVVRQVEVPSWAWKADLGPRRHAMAE